MNTMRSEPEIERALDRLHRADRHAIQAALEDVTEADRASARAFVAAQAGAPGSRRWSVVRSPWAVALPAALVLAGVFVLVPWRGQAPRESHFLGAVVDGPAQRLAAGEPFDLRVPVGYLDQVTVEFLTMGADGVESSLGTRKVPFERVWAPTDADLDALPAAGAIRVRVERTDRTTEEVVIPYTR